MVATGQCIWHQNGVVPFRRWNNARVVTITRPPTSRRSRALLSGRIQGESLRRQEKVCLRSGQHNRSEFKCRAATEEAAQLEEESSASAESLPGGIKRVRVTIPADKVAAAWQKAIRLEGKTHDFPGFRQGKKVPDALIIQRVGKEAVAERTIAKLVQDSLSEAASRYAPNAYEDSLVLEMEPDAPLKFEKDKDFKYTFSLTVQPEVRWKSDYKNLRIEMQASPSEEELRDSAQEKVKAGLKEVGSLRIVQNRGLEIGDVAVIDIELRRKEDGELIEGSQQTSKQIDTATAQYTVELPGFIDDIKGMAVGERRELEYTLPDTWWEPSFKGTDVLCNVQLKELFNWELPRLTDQVAKALMPGCENVADFEAKVMDTERAVAERLRIEELHSTVCQAIAERVDIEIPEFLYRQIGENEYQAELLTSQSNGTLSKEEVEQLATEELLLKYMSNKEDRLRDLVRVTVGMEAIWQEQNLSIDEEQAKAEMEQVKQEALRSGEELDEGKLAAQVFEAMKGSRIIAWLIEEGDVVEVSPQSDAEEMAETAENSAKNAE